MIKKIVSLILFFFISNPAFTQSNIAKSVKVKSIGNLNSNIIFQKNDIISISFDVLGEKKSDYYYQIIHCDYEWNPSKISKFEYIDGFDDIRITNYFFSKNTFQSFLFFRICFFLSMSNSGWLSFVFRKLWIHLILSGVQIYIYSIPIESQ